MQKYPVRPLHLAVLFVTLIALLGYSFTPLATVSATRPLQLRDPCAYDPNNLFTNGMMLPGWNSAYGEVANAWTPFIFAGDAPNFDVVDNEGIDENPGISQQIFETNTFDAGIQQTVNNLQIGANYWIRWGYSLQAKSYPQNISSSTIGRQFGVNPYGGTDPHDARVIWGPIVWGGGAVNLAQMVIVFTARAPSATMFLRAIATVNDGHENRVWIDALCMEARPDLTPSPSPPPLTSPTPSTNFLPLIQVSPAEAGCVAPSVLTSIAVGAQPKGIAVDAGTNRAFVGLFGGSSIAVVDAATNQLVTTWSTNTSGHTNGVAFANNRVFAALRDTNSVAVLDATTGNVLTTKAIGAQPWGAGASNNRIWVANFSTNSISTLDATTNNVIKTLGVGNYPSMVAPAGSHAFVALMSGGIVDVDSAGNQLQNWGWDAGAFGVAFNASANRVYVASRDTNKLAMLNASTGANVTNLTLTNVPYALAYNANTNHLFVVLAEANQVNIRDGTTLADLATLNLGATSSDGGDGIAVLNNRVYISNYAAGAVTVIRDACP